ncbi:MAG: DUF5703 domain-containing protein, partial [bacterium]
MTESGSLTAAQIVMTEPAARPVGGLPIGSGRMGTLVWTTSGAIEFQINRVDVFAVNRHAAGAHFPGPADYGGGCARVSIAVGGDPFRAGPHFAQRLSLADARCEIRGEAVRAACWVAAEDDVLVVEVTDEREAPAPIDVKLAMWREPEVGNGPHTAAYAFHQNRGGIAVVQTFREADHYCSSAVAIGAHWPGGEVTVPDERTRILRLPAGRGARTILVASASSWDELDDAGAAAERILCRLAAPEARAALERGHRRWWQSFRQRTFVDIRSPDGSGEQAARDRELFLYHMACT